MKQRVVITGGMGFIGHALAERLAHRTEPVDVVVVDLPDPILPPTSTEENRRILDLRRARVRELATVATADVRDAATISAVISEMSPDVVIHLAAVSVADQAARNREFTDEVNVDGLRNVLDALHGRETRLVFISSSFVYGDFESDTVDERHPLRPSGAYGATKFQGEQMVRAATALSGLQSVIVRPSAVYGPYDTNRRVVQTFIENARSGQPTTLRGADNVLDFTYVGDLAAGLELAAFHPVAVGRTFNLTTGKGRSLRELAEIVQRYFPDHQVHEAPHDATRPKRGTLDIGFAKMSLGYEPAWDLETGVDSYLDFYRTVADQAVGWQGA